MCSLSIKHYYFDNYRSLQKKNEQYQMNSHKNVPQKDRLQIEKLYYDIQNKTEKYFNKNLKDEPIWEEIELKIKKYTPFIQYNEEKLKKIVLDYFK